MITPPPNVTGYLHIGHALTASIQDSIVRWRRMRGESVSWIPGMDHAGISTQTVVEKKLMRELKKSRHDLGREAFIDQIWDWKNVHGDRITEQFKRIGASMDWNQSFFTLDETRTQAVQSAFIQLFKDGLVYRDTRLVNWCCALETVISDIEVEHEDIPGKTMLNVPGRLKKVEFGVLHDFAYKIENEPTQELVVSTTRIETMLGDEAVAIHPDDERYKHLHGKFVIHPISGKRLPIICDPELVDMAFGTGVVKVTPAHDPNDYACGRRHGLPIVNILDKDGKFNANCGAKSYERLNRFDARDKIIAELKELGLYRGKTENHAMRLARCSRSGDVIEPMVMPQWYIKSEGLAQRALESAANNELVFHSESALKDWNRWLENIQDWCISRQLWWGHRIPAYKPVLEQGIGSSEVLDGGFGDGPWFVAEDEESAHQQIKQFLRDKGLQDQKYRVVQDEDVLDTWFSSGLLPLSALGWTGKELPAGGMIPERYPTNMIETGTDIMFFWVARMVMLCTHLSGEVPFKDIMFHAMVRDAQGRKMSKSVGNVIDPIHVIEGITLKDLKATLEGGNLAPKEVKRSQSLMDKEFPRGIKASGADALRYALVASTQQTRQINLDLSNVTSAQHFANKLWNLSQFYRTRLYGCSHQSSVHAGSVIAAGLDELRNDPQNPLPLPQRFILSRLAETVSKFNASMEELEPSMATEIVRKFIIQDLCDVYVEFSKVIMHSGDIASRTQKPGIFLALQTSFDASLRMMHPFMPFVTEELWQKMLPESAPASTSIMVSSFPSETELASWKDEEAEQHMEIVLSVIQATRSMRQSHQAPVTKALPFTIWSDDPSLTAENGALKKNLHYLEHFGRTQGKVVFIDGSSATDGAQGMSAVDPRSAAHVISPRLKIYTPLAAIQKAIADHQADEELRASLNANAFSRIKKKEQELLRLEKKLVSVRSDLEKLTAKTERPEYTQRVPVEIQKNGIYYLYRTDLHVQGVSRAGKQSQTPGSQVPRSTFLEVIPIPGYSHLPTSKENNMVSASAKKTLILTASAVIGLTTVSTLAYLLIQDDRRAKHQRQVRALQKSLGKKLAQVEKSVEELVEGDIRLSQVRTKTLRTHPIYPGDPHVQLPSLGLVQEQDQQNLGADIQETSDELVRERMLGLAQDPQKVRQGYKKLEFLINSVNERLLRLLESLDAISPREITDLGNGKGGLPSANGFEVQAFEKIRKRKRADIAKIQKIMTQMDHIGNSIKDRVTAVEIYERKAAEAAAEEEEERKKKEQEDEEAKKKEAAAAEAQAEEHVHSHAEDDLVREGVSFAQAAAASKAEHHEEKSNGHAEHDLVRDGVSFADVAKSHPLQESTSFSVVSESEVQEHTAEVKEGVTFAEVAAAAASESTEESAVEEAESEKKEEVLVETEELKRMHEGVTFADVVVEGEAEKSEETEEKESLEAKEL
ncbi:valyl-tRNA synthetase [Entomortierella parvispora]|uniref:valine--tRNA ligase n=1 Tax=Entomortierella parvispora TaxID=205924 RepID=A0A9P3LX93_9FUNG|nr:valyl-tRNA synthetase [Entomortierella parvispora]